MNFTKLPAQFASLYGTLPYNFSGAASPEFRLNIVDVTTGTTLGSKRFCNVSSGSTDIAPVIRKWVRFTPQDGRIGFYEPQDRSLSIQLGGEDTFSEVRTFLPSVGEVTAPALLTAMPRRRVIAYGEYDELTCLIPSDYTISLQSDTLTYPITFTCDKGAPLTLFRLETGYFEPSITSLSLQIIVAGETIDRIDYAVVPPCRQGCRLAWRSSAGSIEHYTFPVVKSIVRKTTREQIYTPTRGYASTGIESQQITTLVSAYEPAPTIAALGELLSSPQVWRVDDRQYEEVDLLPAEQPLFRHGTLCGIEVSIRPKLKSRSPWS